MDRVKQYVVQVPLQYQKALDEGSVYGFRLASSECKEICGRARLH